MCEDRGRCGCHISLRFLFLWASAYMVWCLSLEETAGLPSRSPVQCRLDDHEIAACVQTHKGCCQSPGGLGGSPRL